jgi:hypothetical protein
MPPAAVATDRGERCGNAFTIFLRQALNTHTSPLPRRPGGAAGYPVRETRSESFHAVSRSRSAAARAAAAGSPPASR